MTECEPVYRGTVTELQVQRLKVTITLRDRLEELNTPIGSTVDAAEWPEADGERMPVIAGAAVSVPLFWLDRVLLIAAVHDGAATVSGVFDLGVALTAGSDYADMAAMKSTAPASGQYRVLSTASGTFVRLGSRPQDHDKMAADVATATSAGSSQLRQIAQRAQTMTPIIRQNLIDYSDDLSMTSASSTIGTYGGGASVIDSKTIQLNSNSGVFRAMLSGFDAQSDYAFQCEVKAARSEDVGKVLQFFANWNGNPGATPVVTVTLTETWQALVSAGTSIASFNSVRLTFTGPVEQGAFQINVRGLQGEPGLTASPLIKTFGQSASIDDQIGYTDYELPTRRTDLEALERDWPIGGWWPGEATILDAVSEVARSLGAVIFFDRLGKLSAARLTPEVGAGVIGVYGPQVRSPGGGARRATELDRVRLGKPAKEISVGYAKSHAVFSDLGALWDTAPARAERISRDFARSVVEGAGVASKHLLASSMRLDTILNDKTQAETVAEELRAAQGAWFHSVIIPADEAAFEALDLGARVDIHESRWSGAVISTVVREIAHDLTAGTITLGVRE
ncbi:hypothetical protein [Oceanicaulis sp.]|uniref:hypothetical protein n=1 Tax=Oceanicaulis sp. TaxID=1924941 RepID=UPI003F71F8D1